MPAELCRHFGRHFYFTFFFKKHFSFIINILYLYFLYFYKMCINYINNFTFLYFNTWFFSKKTYIHNIRQIKSFLFFPIYIFFSNINNLPCVIFELLCSYKLNRTAGIYFRQSFFGICQTFLRQLSLFLDKCQFYVYNFKKERAYEHAGIYSNTKYCVFNLYSIPYTFIFFC